MFIHIIHVGAIHDQAIIMLSSEILKRLQAFAQIEVSIISDEKYRKLEVLEYQKNTTKQVLGARKNDRIYLTLREKGLSMDTKKCLEWLEKKTSQTGKIGFIVAGPYGFDESQIEDIPSLSLSPMTFPHEWAYVLLLEQLYRMHTLIHGKKYHY